MKRTSPTAPACRNPLLVLSLVLFAVIDSDSTAADPPAKGEPAAKPARPANRLATETSPYLLQHARNPVDWYPWGDEAFEKAKADGKLVFLSVGYSSCHWCHVMEHESFEDDEIAAYLNEHFVCVKVDREERPDVDGIYMQAVQLLTRRGGWPMSVFMTAEAKPFYGGSYFPARDGDRPGVPGFLTLIKAIQEAWTSDQKSIHDSAEEVAKALQKQMDVTSVLPPAEPSQGLVDLVQRRLAEEFDAEHGGFGFDESKPQMPKFPEPSNLVYLLHRAKKKSLPEDVRGKAQFILLRTLDKMAAGGIQDHLGGGFHRYSVDRFWQITHFEKMLYDNGQLASVYAEAYALTGESQYRWIVEDLLDWAMREMRDSQGGFYAAIDADSEGEEGAYYRWTSDEFSEFSKSPKYDTFARLYQLSGEPNFEDRFYVPQMKENWKSIASEFQVSDEQLRGDVAALRQTMLEARTLRTAPQVDTKVLTSWNGLMITGLADAGRLLQRADYTDAAKQAATFVLESMRQDDGSLYRTFGAGQARLNGYLDDYAMLVQGLLAIHRATDEKEWLEFARELTNLQIAKFWDEERGGFYFTSQNHQSLIARAKDPVDSAIPSGNSVAALNLLYLSKHVRDQNEYRTTAEQTLTTIAGLLKRSPSSAPLAAVAMDVLLDEPQP